MLKKFVRPLFLLLLKTLDTISLPLSSKLDSGSSAINISVLLSNDFPKLAILLFPFYNFITGTFMYSSISKSDEIFCIFSIVFLIPRIFE